MQNGLLLLVSYVFYSFWDWRFLFLLIFSTVLDYYSGLKIAGANSRQAKRFWLILSIVINVGFLAFFKYFNFFITSFADLLSLAGFKVNIWTLNVILPVGISFYTFHGLSYVLDIYYNRIPAEKNFVQYSVFVSYFPLLVAGPIERATHLLPQIKTARTFNYTKAVDGLRQILWGLFKKVVIADNCAEYVNEIFRTGADYSGSTNVLGAFLFAMQIYGDFSGYSDIALGVSRLMGIELLRNFAFPYFSRDIAEFWRRWHISLSSWFRDYLYIPLGGSKVGTIKKVRNTFIIFLVSGFWHGANWTFIFWGLLNALYIMPSIIFNTHRDHIDIVAKGKHLPTAKEFFSISITFMLTVFAWIFFRSNSMSSALVYIQNIFDSSFFSIPEINIPEINKQILLLLVGFFLTVEWLGRESDFAIRKIVLRIPRTGRWVFYFFLAVLVFMYQGKEQAFIYFQF